MPNQHEHPARVFRPNPDDEWTPAKAVVDAAGLDMNRVLRAVMRWIAADPTQALRALKPHLPPVALKGRPRRGVSPDGSGSPENPAAAI